MQITRNIILCTVIFSTLAYSSCKSLKNKEPIKNPKNIVANFDSFWKYWNEDVKLSEDFVCYNEKRKSL